VWVVGLVGVGGNSLVGCGGRDLHAEGRADCNQNQSCTALHCTARHCTPLHCTPLHATARHCTACHCTARHCTARHCTARHCTARTQKPDASARSCDDSAPEEPWSVDDTDADLDKVCCCWAHCSCGDCCVGVFCGGFLTAGCCGCCAV